MGDCPRCSSGEVEMLFSEKRYDKAAVDDHLKKGSVGFSIWVSLAIPVYTWTYYRCEVCDLVFTESSYPKGVRPC